MPDLNAVARRPGAHPDPFEHDMPDVDLHAYDEVILNDSGKQSLA